MQGMSSSEWSAYLRDQLGVPLSARQINDQVVARLLGYYQDDLPLVPGANEAVRRMADSWPLGLASSSNRTVIDARPRASRPGPVLPGYRLFRGGGAREAGSGRLSGGCRKTTGAP